MKHATKVEERYTDIDETLSRYSDFRIDKLLCGKSLRRQLNFRHSKKVGKDGERM